MVYQGKDSKSSKPCSIRVQISLNPRRFSYEDTLHCLLVFSRLKEFEKMRFNIILTNYLCNNVSAYSHNIIESINGCTRLHAKHVVENVPHC